MTVAQFAETVRVSFAKVAEFQRRAVVHFHALIRLDAYTGDGEHRAPTVDIGFDVLEQAVRAAAAQVTVHAIESQDRTVTLTFGKQLDVRAVNTGLPGELTGRAVAAYISKYATKAAEDHGLGVDDGKVNPHGARLLATGRRLAETVTELSAMGRWEHMLFYGGHFSTKSRRYSTTLGALRRARADYQRRSDRTARRRQARWGRVPEASLGPAKQVDEGVSLATATFEDVVKRLLNSTPMAKRGTRKPTKPAPPIPTVPNPACCSWSD
jgi:hypothetical protein